MTRCVAGVEAADFVFRMGDLPGHAACWQALDAAAPGPQRVRGLLLLAMVMSWEDGDEQVAELCDQALGEAGTTSCCTRAATPRSPRPGRAAPRSTSSTHGPPYGSSRRWTTRLLTCCPTR